MLSIQYLLDTKSSLKKRMNEPYERVGLHPTTDTMYGGELYHHNLITFESDFKRD